MATKSVLVQVNVTPPLTSWNFQTLSIDFWVHNLIMARAVITNSKLGMEPFMVVKGRKELHYNNVYMQDIKQFQHGSRRNRIHNLSQDHEAILRSIRSTVKRLDGGMLGTHKIATWIPILGPFSIYIHIYMQIIRKIPELSECLFSSRYTRRPRSKKSFHPGHRPTTLRSEQGHRYLCVDDCGRVSLVDRCCIVAQH